jgi:hypothetical protein
MIVEYTQDTHTINDSRIPSNARFGIYNPTGDVSANHSASETDGLKRTHRSRSMLQQW